MQENDLLFSLFIGGHGDYWGDGYVELKVGEPLGMTCPMAPTHFINAVWLPDL
jgi:hypothetical protein